MTKKLTIFSDDSFNKDYTDAVRALTTGKTPAQYVRRRTIRGGREANYVDGYYMFRQASLLTGWRWSSECLQEKFYPNETNPREIGAQIKVTLYDQEGNSFSHISWGSSGIPRWERDGKSEDGTFHKAGDIISLFDCLKSAYTDGIKKALSYFGIANDIYAGKEPEYFSENNEGGDSLLNSNINNQRTAFDVYIREHHIPYSKVIQLLNVQSMADVTDFATAFKVVKLWNEGGRKEPADT